MPLIPSARPVISLLLVPFVWLLAGCDDSSGPSAAEGGQGAPSGAPDAADSMTVEEHCLNGVLDDGETDIDCGGTCIILCSPGKTCASDSDCKNAECVEETGRCASCDDGILNNHETGVDCGGNQCGPRCSNGNGCKSDADCTTDVPCILGVCVATCKNGVQDGGETAVDCGGPCALLDSPQQCEEGDYCIVAADCTPKFPCLSSSHRCGHCWCGSDGVECGIDECGVDCGQCPKGKMCHLGKCKCVTETCALFDDGALEGVICEGENQFKCFGNTLYACVFHKDSDRWQWHKKRDCDKSNPECLCTTQTFYEATCAVAPDSASASCGDGTLP